MDYDTTGSQPLSFYEANRRAFLWFGTGLSLMMFAVVLGLAYSLGAKDSENASTILTDNGPLKSRPQDPGGKSFIDPNSIRIQDTETEKADYSLRESSEKPLKRTPAEEAALAQAEIQIANKKEDLQLTKRSPILASLKPQEFSDEKPKSQENAAQGDLSVEQIIIKSAGGVPKAAGTYREPLIVAKKENSAFPAPFKSETDVKPVASAGSFLQLGAYRSQEEANSAWRKISAKGAGLSGHSPNVMRADLKDRGVFYRLRVGPFRDKNEATALCNDLKSKSQPCMYIP